MGVTFEYFGAEDDAAAAALAERGPTAAGVAAVPGGEIDPTTHLAPVVALVLDRPVSEVVPTFGDPVALVNGGEQIVLPLTGTVAEALARLDDERIGPLATTWADDSSFWRPPALADLAAFLSAAAALARAGLPLYCWLSV